jgi:hypothetical protein
MRLLEYFGWDRLVSIDSIIADVGSEPATHVGGSCDDAASGLHGVVELAKARVENRRYETGFERLEPLDTLATMLRVTGFTTILNGRPISTRARASSLIEPSRLSQRRCCS